MQNYKPDEQLKYTKLKDFIVFGNPDLNEDEVEVMQKIVDNSNMEVVWRLKSLNSSLD